MIYSTEASCDGAKPQIIKTPMLKFDGTPSPIMIAYRVYLKYYVILENKVGHQRYGLKFDTGADYTIIRIPALLRLINSNKSEGEFRAWLTMNYADKMIPDCLGTYTGEGVKCLPCILHNIYINNNLIEKLYVLLDCSDTKGRANTDGLLGRNFEHFCTYYHNAGGNIHIVDFDNTGYQAYNEGLTSDSHYLKKLDGKGYYDIFELYDNFNEYCLGKESNTKYGVMDYFANYIHTQYEQE